jgi:hypothetical protein
MSTMMPIALPLIPKLLRARGLDVSRKRLGQALLSGAIPGRLEQGRWILSEADVDAAERYFRDLAARGSWKGGAAGLERARSGSLPTAEGSAHFPRGSQCTSAP